MAPWIISHFPEHRIYVEPFGGAASVLLRKSRSYAEVYNDLDGIVVNLFRVLQDKEMASELERRMRLTPFAREEFELAYEETTDHIEMARRTLIRSFMGFGSDGVHLLSTGFRSNSNKSGTTPAHDWVNYWDRIKEFTERLAGVVIEQRPAIEVMLNHDSPETLHYVDPPYVHETRGKKHAYRFEMTDYDHKKLLECLVDLKGYVFLSGYDHDSYEDLGWQRKTIKALADGARERTEVLWMNSKAFETQKQMVFF